MKISRFYADENGGSRFTDMDIPIDYRREDLQGNVIYISKAFSSPKVRFVELPEGYDHDWHNSPARQLVILLSGLVEVRTSDNQVQRFGPGEVLFADDTTGVGHQTRAIGGPVQMVYLPLTDEFSLEN